MHDCIQVTMLCVQILGLAGLSWYAIETMKIRKAAQKQVETSLALIKAANAQAEGAAKPCLTLWGELRDGADAILNMDGAVGNIVACPDQGSYVVLNIGNGVALNVRYRFTRPNDDPNHPREMRYIPNLAPTGKARLVETLGGFKSIGGRRYQTTIHLNHRVITTFDFSEG